MKELREIYDRITYLRQKGMKMKDIAGCIDFAPSVLSALYTTVLPGFTPHTPFTVISFPETVPKSGS
jgi:hypothetical protein